MQLTDALAATVAQVIPIYLAALAVTVNVQRARARDHMLNLYRPWVETMEQANELHESGVKGQALLDQTKEIAKSTLAGARERAGSKVMLWFAHALALIFFVAFQILEAVAFIMCLLTLAGWDGGKNAYHVVLVAVIAGLASLGVFPFFGYVVMPGPLEMYRMFRSYTKFLRITGEARNGADAAEMENDSDASANDLGKSA